MKYKENYLKWMIEIMYKDYCKEENGVLTLQPSSRFNFEYNKYCMLICLKYIKELKGENALLLIKNNELNFFTKTFFTNRASFEYSIDNDLYNILEELDEIIINEIRNNILPSWLVVMNGLERIKILESIIYSERHPTISKSYIDILQSRSNLIKKGKVYKKLINLDKVFELDPSLKKTFIELCLTDDK